MFRSTQSEGRACVAGARSVPRITPAACARPPNLLHVCAASRAFDPLLPLPHPQLPRSGANLEVRIAVTRIDELGAVHVVVVRKTAGDEWLLPGGCLPHRSSPAHPAPTCATLPSRRIPSHRTVPWDTASRPIPISSRPIPIRPIPSRHHSVAYAAPRLASVRLVSIYLLGYC